jgi:hypothetical protein
LRGYNAAQESEGRMTQDARDVAWMTSV